MSRYTVGALAAVGTLLVLLAVVGVTAARRPHPGASASASAFPSPVTAGDVGCLRDVAACRAGAEVPAYLLNPDVTQDTVRSTVCVAGWTATVRPSSARTTAEKRVQLAFLGSPPAVDRYEEDHWEPLELGGAPDRDVGESRNLWPEPRADATAKDAEEGRLHAAVCADPPTLTLAAARLVMWRDWGPGRR